MCLHPVLTGKRAEGTDDARFCALYGITGPLPYDRYVSLILAEDAAVAALAKVVVVGNRVSSGGVGPREYYESETAWMEALLRSRLSRVRSG